MLLMYHIGNAQIYLFHINRSKPQMWKKSIFWIFFFKDEEKQNDERICACLKEPYCTLLNCAAVWIHEAIEKHMLESKLELKEVKISISCFLFFVCFTSRSSPCLQPNRFVSEQSRAEWLRVLCVCVCVRLRTHTWTISVYLCVWLPSCTCPQCV